MQSSKRRVTHFIGKYYGLKKLVEDAQKGRFTLIKLAQIFTAFVVTIGLIVGFCLELKNYTLESHSFDTILLSTCFIACLLSLFLLIYNAVKNYSFALLIMFYVTDVFILYYNYVGHHFEEGSGQHEFFIRSVFFVLTTIPIVGFLNNKRQTYVQGLFMVIMLTVQYIYIRDQFIVDNYLSLCMMAIVYTGLISIFVKNTSLYYGNMILKTNELNANIELQKKLSATVIELSKVSLKSDYIAPSLTDEKKNILDILMKQTSLRSIQLWCLSEVNGQSGYERFAYENGENQNCDVNFIPRSSSLIKSLFSNEILEISQDHKLWKDNKELLGCHWPPVNQCFYAISIYFEEKVIGFLTFRDKPGMLELKPEVLICLQSAVDQILMQELREKNLRLSEKLKSKNAELISSIRYAKRIQKTLLPSEKKMGQIFHDAFIIYQPKDIVSGDFYWLEKKNDLIFFAVADATGHGVPGAFVALCCLDALNESLYVHGITSPKMILEKAREILQHRFNSEEDAINDGMDISLCVIDVNERKIGWSGANLPLLQLDPNAINLMVHTPNKQPVGKFIRSTPFEEKWIKAQPGSVFYMTTDGYIDQFGGPKNKKMKSTRFHDALLSSREESLSTQKVVLNEFFETWKASEEQTDDVCIAAFRV